MTQRGGDGWARVIGTGTFSCGAAWKLRWNWPGRVDSGHRAAARTGYGDVSRPRKLAQCRLSSPDAGAKPTRPRAQETLDSTETLLTGSRQTRSGERRRIPESSLSRRRHRRRSPRALTPCPGTRSLFAPGGSARPEAPPPDPRPRPWLSDTALPCSPPPRRLRARRSPCVC